MFDEFVKVLEEEKLFEGFRIYVFAGPNGSGKSTFLRYLSEFGLFKDLKWINPDEIIKSFGIFSKEEDVLLAVKLSKKLRENYLKNRISFLFETVFSSEEKLNFLKRARKSGAKIFVFYLCTDDPTLNAKRVAQRVIQDGHEVPIKKIIDRYYRSLNLIISAAKYIDYLFFIDTSKSGFKFLFSVKRGYINFIFDDFDYEILSWAQHIVNNLDISKKLEILLENRGSVR